MVDVSLADGSVVAPLISRALRRAMQSWDGLVERLPIGVYAFDRTGSIVHFNRRAAEIWGCEPQAGALPPAVLAPPFFTPHHAHANDAAAESPISEVLRTGQPAHDREIGFDRPDGERRILLASVDPLFDEDGALVGGMNCFQDVTELHQARARAAEREHRLTTILEALPAAIYTTDLEGRVTFFNRAAAELAGREPVLGQDHWCVTWKIYLPDGTRLPHDQCPMAVALKENRAVRGVDAVAERPDGRRVPFMPFPTPLRDASGAPVGAVNMLVDITERKQAEARQKALVAELNHRVKNTLSTVQSLAAQSLRGSGASPESLGALQDRLLALSAVHDELSRERWEAADLEVVAGAVLAPFAVDGRIVISGAPTRIAPNAALLLAMALNELATNAGKYGALTAPSGRVALSWTVEPTPEASMLVLEWRESGGPPVVEPQARGFGLQLIQRGVAHELAGSASIAFAPEGLSCRIVTPLS